MAVNLEKLKARKADLENKGSGGKNSVMWRPEEGEQEIRILPEANEDPFHDFWIHYGVGKGGVLCPKRNFDEECPICDYASDLWRNGDEADQKAAKKLFVKQRFFSAIVPRADETLTPKLYGYGEKTYKKFIDLQLNPKIGDFTDVEQGQDFSLSYEKPKNPGAYPQTDLNLLPVRSGLVETKSGKLDSKKVKEILDNCPDLDEAVFAYLGGRKSPAEVKELLDKHLANPYGNEVAKYGASPDATTDLDDAIDQLTAE